MNKLTSLFVVATLIACGGQSSPPPDNTASAAVAPAATAVVPAETASSTPDIVSDDDSVLGLKGATQISVRYPLSSEANETITDASVVQTLVAALGDGPILDVVPKCLPKVQLTFLAGDIELVTVSFCDATLRTNAMRIDGPKSGTGTIKVIDAEPFQTFFETKSK